MECVIDIRALDFSFRGQPVLEKISLTVNAGTTLGIVGPNGGGKTTLIRLLVGLLKPTAGTIRIGGMLPVEAVRRGDVVGYVPQNAQTTGSIPLTVRELVRLGLAGKTGMFRPDRKEDVAFADAVLDRVGLTDLADERVASLSGGQLQRLYIARALAPKPRVLLLDEPTTGIDPASQQRFTELLGELKHDFGLTIVFVSHDLRAVSAISDRIACLNRTLHYHDVPDHLPPQLVYNMFACDLEAMGIRNGHVCTHDHPAPTQVAITEAVR